MLFVCLALQETITSSGLDFSVLSRKILRRSCVELRVFEGLKKTARWAYMLF